MKKSNIAPFVTAICVVAVLVILVGIKVNADERRLTEWKENCTIITVIVEKGNTLDGFGYKYKPEWMDVREYRYHILELNDMPSAMLYEGQTLQLYIQGGN